MSVTITPQATPNPNAMKFNLSVKLVESGSLSLNSPDAAGSHPWAKAILELDGVGSIFALGSFVTVMQDGSADWNTLAGKVEEALRGNL